MDTKYSRTIPFLIIAWFVFLCSLHLAVQRPLWNDEQAVFLSVKAFSLQDMFSKDLIRLQVFPRVYLFCIQQFSKWFHFSLWSLRLLPFVCMLTSFYLWVTYTKGAFKRPASYWCFLLSWPASMMMVYYAAELKPYSMDVLAGICALWLLKKRSKWVFVYPLFGFFSYPAFLFALFFLYNFFVESFRDSSKWRQTALFLLTLTAVLGLSYHFDMQHRNLRGVSEGYHDYFIATDSAGGFFQTFGQGMKNLFVTWLVRDPLWVRNMCIFFMILGFFRMIGGFAVCFKKEGYTFRSLETLPFGLLVGLIVLGMLKKYPFIVPRTVLFMCPIILYLAVKGIEAFDKIHHNAYTVVLSVYAAYLIFLTVWFPSILLSGERLFQPLFSKGI